MGLEHRKASIKKGRVKIHALRCIRTCSPSVRAS